MISAGVPLIQALEMASKTRSIGKMRQIIPVLIMHMQSGLTFTDSMVRIHGWMPEFDVALLSVGEQSGRLDNSFKLLANYYTTRAKIIRDTISRSIVTVATLHVFLLVFPLSYLIGMARGIMDNNFSECVPFIVEKIAVFGGLYALAFSCIYAFQGNRGGNWRAAIESVLQMVPILRTARKHLVLSRLAASLEALINAGVPMTKSWEYAAAASGSPQLVNSIAGWGPELDRGATPADLVNRNRFFPEMFANLYATGEHTGKLDETLLRLQSFHQEEGFRGMDRFTRVLSATVYGGIVILVGYNVIHFWMNYYGNIMNTMNGF
jgi:type II secretory pathway component PulF